MAEIETTVRIIYNGTLEKIPYTGHANYEEVLGHALDRFNIPKEQMDSIRITNGGKYIFTKQMFENYVSWFPNPKRNFHIQLGDYSSEESSESDSESGPLVIDVNKKRKECEAELSDEPKARRLKISKQIDVTMKKLAKRRRSALRI